MANPKRPQDDRLRSALTAHFEAVADAADPSLNVSARHAAALRVPGLAAAVLAAIEAHTGQQRLGQQLTGHRFTLLRDPPPAYSRAPRVYARQLRQGDLLHGWADADGVHWFDPPERVAVWLSDGDYVTVRTSVDRDLILDGWVTVALGHREA